MWVYIYYRHIKKIIFIMATITRMCVLVQSMDDSRSLEDDHPFLSYVVYIRLSVVSMV